MADAVLDVVAQFGKGLLVAFGFEDGVVAEALPSPTLADDVPFHDAFKKVRAPVLSLLDPVLNQADDRAESGFSVVRPLHLGQQFGHVRLRVVSLSTGIACRVDSGFAVQRFHLESGVIGKHIIMVFVEDILCFDQGILVECGACFGYILVAPDVVQREQFEIGAENLSDFIQLMGVVGSKYDFHVSCFSSLFCCCRGLGSVFTFTLMESKPSP